MISFHQHPLPTTDRTRAVWLLHGEGGPRSGTDSVQPQMAARLQAPAGPTVAQGAGSMRHKPSVTQGPTVTPQGLAYTPACSCLGTGRTVPSSTGAVMVTLVCACVFLPAARCGVKRVWEWSWLFPGGEDRERGSKEWGP